MQTLYVVHKTEGKGIDFLSRPCGVVTSKAGLDPAWEMDDEAPYYLSKFTLTSSAQ